MAQEQQRQLQSMVRRFPMLSPLFAVMMLTLTLSPNAVGAVSCNGYGEWGMDSAPVGRKTLNLKDASRGDRPVVVDVWYPAATTMAASSNDNNSSRYIEMTQADLEDFHEYARYNPLLPSDGTYHRAFESPPKLEPLTAPELLRPSGSVYPLIVFSHGSNGLRSQSATLMECLASNGFVVAAPDHAGNSFNDDPTLDIPYEPLDRPLDIRFVLDKLLEDSPESPYSTDFGISSESPVGLIGNSAGGPTTAFVVAGYEAQPPIMEQRQATNPSGARSGIPLLEPDPRVKAILPISPADPTYYGASADTLSKIKVPMLLVGGADDVVTPPSETNAAYFEQAVDSLPRWNFVFQDAGHTSFQDTCVFYKIVLENFANGNVELAYSLMGSGDQDVGRQRIEEAFCDQTLAETLPFLNLIATAFFRATLRGDTSARDFLITLEFPNAPLVEMAFMNGGGTPAEVDPPTPQVMDWMLWSIPIGDRGTQLSDFRAVAKALGDQSKLVPRYYILDGTNEYEFRCGNSGDGTTVCGDDFKLCTNHGRYCAEAPDGWDTVTGADVVKESLRRLCIWKTYGDPDDVGEAWWDYSLEFAEKCNNPDNFVNEACLSDCYNTAGIDARVIDRCISNSGGLDEDAPNEHLEAQILARYEEGDFGVQDLPMLVMISTGVIISGPEVVMNSVVQNICSHFRRSPPEFVPEVCDRCAGVDWFFELFPCVVAWNGDLASGVQRPAANVVIDYELWTVPTDQNSTEFLSNFALVAKALGDRASLTPRYFIGDGIREYRCGGSVDGDSYCDVLCTNHGRYCADAPDGQYWGFGEAVTGAEVVQESLRRLCIWKHYGEQDGVGETWWDYLGEFSERCNNPDYFNNEYCVKDCYEQVGIDASLIDRCMMWDSGGLDNDAPNELLETQLAIQNRLRIAKQDLPTVFATPALERNGKRLNETNPTKNAFVLFTDMCYLYPEGTAPDICTECGGGWEFGDVLQCAVQDGLGGDDDDAPVSKALASGSSSGWWMLVAAAALVQMLLS